MIHPGHGYELPDQINHIMSPEYPIVIKKLVLCQFIAQDHFLDKDHNTDSLVFCAGFLLEHGYKKTSDMFLRECPYMKEVVDMQKRGRTASTSLSGKSLEMILDEYATMELKGTSIFFFFFFICLMKRLSIIMSGILCMK